jgi:hypothetical protein
MIANKGAKSAAKAQTQAAKTASDAQVQSTQMQIDALNKGANAGEAELRPLVDQGIDPTRYLQGAQGLNGEQGLKDYNKVFDTSVYAQNRNDATSAAYRTGLTSNAASGRGGSYNSSKALNALQDNLYNINRDATGQHMAGLSAFKDSADAARAGIANIKIGQSAGISNAFGASGAIQSNIAMRNGENQANIIGANAGNMAGAFGALTGQLSNVKWGNAFNTGVRTPPIATSSYRPLATVNNAIPKLKI